MAFRGGQYTPCGRRAEPGQPWVLLRGLVREHRHWGGFAQQFADHMGTPVYCPDLPGNGSRCRESSPGRLLEALSQIRETLPGIAPLNLLGLSMGGMVAALWAQRYPQDVHSLVLVNSSFGDLSPPWQRIRPPALLQLLGALACPIDSREATIYDLTCNRTDIREPTLAEWRGYGQDCPVSHANFVRQLMASACCRAGRKRPIQPTLILASDRDRLVNPACSTAIAKRWSARLLYHAAAGHDLPHDDPDWVLEHIAQWQAELEEDRSKVRDG